MRLVLLILLLCPVLAFAEPLTLTAFTIGAGATAVAVSWGTVIFTIGSMLYGAAAQRKQKKAAAAAAQRERDSFNAGLRDRTISGIATEFPFRYVYGVDRVGANIVAMFSSGARDEYKHMVCVLAQHRSQSIDDIYINGQALGALDADGGVTGGPFLKVETSNVSIGVPLSGGPTTVVSLAHTPLSGTVEVLGFFYEGETGVLQPVLHSLVGQTLTINSEAGPFTVNYQYRTQTSMVRVIKHLGVPGDTVDATLQAEVGSALWPSTATLNGHTYFVLRLNLNQAEFQGGLPQIEALMHGKPLYDPRTTLTAWSDNPALAVYDYLTSELGTVAPTSIPMAGFIAAANDCDDVVSTGSWSGKRYTLNGSITSDQPREEVLEKMAQAMAGGIDATTWTIFAGKYSAPVMAVYQEDIVGEFGISPGLPLTDVYNTVKGQFISSENSYVATDYKPYQNAAYLAVDGEQLDTNLDMPFTNSQQRCTNLARIFTEENRNGFTISGKFSLKLWKLQVGQRFTFTSAFFGQSAKVFRLTDKSFAPDRMMQISAKEDAESIYDLADETQVDATPNTGLPNAFSIDPLASLTCTSGTATLLMQADGTIVSRILVAWPISTTQGVLQKGYIEVEYQKLGEADWQKQEADGAETTAYLSPVEDGQFYNVRARAVNPYVSTKSDWVFATLHEVIGKTEPPPNITDLSISGAELNWTPSGVADSRGYVFRFHYGNNLDWGTAAPLHTGYILASPFSLGTRPGGLVTIMGKEFDTSGNESLATGDVVINLGEAPVANVVETIDLAAEGFPGDVTNGGLVGAALLADAVNSLYGPGPQSFYGPGSDPFYKVDTYAQMVYVSREIGISSALAGSLLTLQLEFAGVDMTVEYRRSGPASFYGDGAEPFYGTGADSFYGPPGVWIPWPGQIVAANDVYQLRITIGAGATRAELSACALVLDAPDIVEYLEDVSLDIAGTVPPYASTFTVIKTVTPSLQVLASGATNILIDKSVNLAPKFTPVNGITPVAGAKADFIIKGY